ncbi:excisionase [Bacteroidia bacterium]|nr:excisionase [Bacteroidia bacterium]
MKKGTKKTIEPTKVGSISERMQAMENIMDRNYIHTKEVFNIKEAAIYLGVSKSYIYKLTAYPGKVPFFKPTNKNIYIKKSDLDEWRTANLYISYPNAQRKARAIVKTMKGAHHE